MQMIDVSAHLFLDVNAVISLQYEHDSLHHLVAMLLHDAVDVLSTRQTQHHI